MSKAAQLTPSQREAVETTGCSILVSAAAGTGKTHVLSERCAHLVCEAKPPCSVDELLVVTFTEAAAAEMRTRIGQAIQRRLDARPSSGRLRRQLALLDAASISTIHAFCRRLVRQWFSRLDVEPDVEVMEDEEAQLIRHETMEALFDELYQDRRGDGLGAGFRSLLDTYAMGRDERIGEMVLGLHAFVQSLPEPDVWLDCARDRVRPAGRDDVVPPPMNEARCALLRRRAAILSEAATLEARIVAELYPPGRDYAEKIDALGEQLGDWAERLASEPDATASELEPTAVDALVDEIARYQGEKVKPKRKQDPEDKRLRDAAAEVSKRVFRRFDSELKDRAVLLRRSAIINELARIGPHVATLVEITKAFERRYRSVKRAEGRVDFNDLERLALDLLSADAGGTTPSDVAIGVQEDFRHVLIDEFQDVNPVQNAILRLVSRETDPRRDDNLFAVGDVKQSIYRFRLAAPEIFVDRSEAFESPGAGKLIWLQENFRSRGEVLDAVNAVFARIMRPVLGGLAYDERARLERGADYPEDLEGGFAKPAVELHLIEKDLAELAPDADHALDADEDTSGADESVLAWEAVEREALLAGQRILELTGRIEGYEPVTVCEKNPDPAGPDLRARPIELRDIVILLRTARNKANYFERVFRNLGIPVYADLTSGYFAALEVQDCLSLLQVIDNARQDIPLAAVLRSPMMTPALSESQIVEIRLHAQGVPFHQAVARYGDRGPDEDLRRRLQELFARLQGWRDELRRRPLADVVWQILVDTGYWAYVGGLRNGLQRRANLVKLHERARQFGRFARQGLHRFLRFIEQLDERGRDLGIAPAVSEAENVVRIMSIHRSKGLEYPVVILPDLGKQFNLEDARRTMMFDHDQGIGMPVLDHEQGVRYPTLSAVSVADEIGRQVRAEEMRILYVAMTRAREHLVLIGTTDLADVERHRQRGPLSREALPLIDLVSAKAPLDWLVPTVAGLPADVVSFSSASRPPCGAEHLFTVHQHDAAAVAQWPSPEQASSAAETALKPFAALAPAKDARSDDPEVRDVIQRITQPYPHEALGGVPAVVAASETKRRFAGDHEADERCAPMSFAAPPSRQPRFAVRADRDTPPLPPAERGTLVHLVLQHLDLTRPCDAEDIAHQADEMVDRALLTEPERRSLAIDRLAWLFTTELGKRMLARPDRVWREVPFVLGVPPDRVVPGLAYGRSDEPVVLVRGMIDCVLSDGDGDEVIDFKTDEISRRRLDERAAHYRGQIDLYAEAVERIWRRTVAGRWLVFLSLPEIVEVPSERP